MLAQRRLSIIGGVMSNFVPLAERSPTTNQCLDKQYITNSTQPLARLSIVTNILLVSLVCIIVTRHNEMFMHRTLSHKRAHIYGYYKWQKHYDEVSCILN
jgi:hypothetical protein